MLAHQLLNKAIQEALSKVYSLSIHENEITLQKTRKEFEGDFTLVTFPFIKAAKQSPEQVGDALGKFLTENNKEITKYNVVKGFLNLSLSNDFWLGFFNTESASANYGFKNEGTSGKTIMLEYSSPNTNKPLHLGHIRNNLLGYSVAEILKTQGHKVIKANLVNDRGVHICKSMLAWKKFGKGETPQSSGMKGDHLVGKYYVEFDKAYKKELEYANNLAKEVFEKIQRKNRENTESKLDENQKIIIVAMAAVILIAAVAYFFLKEKNKKLEVSDEDKDKLAEGNLEDVNAIKQAKELNEYKDINQKIAKLKKELESPEIKYKLTGDSRTDFNILYEDIKNQLELVKEVQEMLRKWEAGDKETIDLWKMMNGWVYDGFAKTYSTLGVNFDKMYYESNTYLFGKEIIQEGLAKNVFYKKENGSVAIDLSAEGLDEKIVLRSDGTSVYITQDIGTAIERFKEFPTLNQLIYTVGNEQDYHFKVLFKILEKLGYAWAKECYHLSYGMVELPEGKMKSREGTVVDADDLLEEMFSTAEQTTKELGKVEGFTEEELKTLYHTIGSGALKYFMLKVDPKKKMLFDPKESIDFNGHTGPFIQYTYARIQSVLTKAGTVPTTADASVELNELERELIKLMYEFPSVLEESAKTYNPALIANYAYELTKSFNRFYHDYSILKEEDEKVKQMRVMLAKQCSDIIRKGMKLLGIEVPNRM